MPNPISDCCKEETITHCADEGTCYMSCLACGLPCNPFYQPKQNNIQPMQLGYYQIFWENGMNTFEYRYRVEVETLRNEGIIDSFSLVNVVNGINLPKHFGEITEWPQEGDKYWFVTTTGTAKDETFTRNSDCKARKEAGNVFRTEAEALKKGKEFLNMLKV